MGYIMPPGSPGPRHRCQPFSHPTRSLLAWMLSASLTALSSGQAACRACETCVHAHLDLGAGARRRCIRTGGLPRAPQQSAACAGCPCRQLFVVQGVLDSPGKLGRCPLHGAHHSLQASTQLRQQTSRVPGTSRSLPTMLGQPHWAPAVRPSYNSNFAK